MRLNRAARKYVDIPIQVTLRNNTVVSIDSIQVALIAVDQNPTLATVWTTTPVVNNVATIMLAGHEATVPEGAFVVPTTGVDLWIRVVDNLELDPVKVERITST